VEVNAVGIELVRQIANQVALVENMLGGGTIRRHPVRVISGYP